MTSNGLSAPLPLLMLPISAEQYESLQAPFPADQILFRAGRGSSVFSYLDARQVEQRLTEVFGLYGWRFEYKGDSQITQFEGTQYNKPVTKLHIARTARIEIWDEERKVWVWREGTGEAIDSITDENLHKTAASDAFKRAAVPLGVGAYLYDLPKWFHAPSDLTDKKVLTLAAKEKFRQLYAESIGHIYVSRSQYDSLRNILLLTGKWSDEVAEKIERLPRHRYAAAAEKAALDLPSGTELLKNQFEAVVAE